MRRSLVTALYMGCWFYGMVCTRRRRRRRRKRKRRRQRMGRGTGAAPNGEDLGRGSLSAVWSDESQAAGAAALLGGSGLSALKTS